MTATAQNLMDLNRQWASRPDDQRFTSLEALAASVNARKGESWTTATRVSDLRVQPHGGEGLGLIVRDTARNRMREIQPTNWSFGQLSSYAGAPAGYMRKLPAELAAINLQWGLEHAARNEDALILGHVNGHESLRAITTTSYGRIWDADVVAAVQRVNADGRWQIPAASYATKNPTRATTLYASDRDVWMFLCDPSRPIEVDGEQLYRGFMVWNSEVGSATFGLTSFLYRYVCDNRIVWGATDVKELRIRHTGGAPQRFAYEGARLLQRYSEESDAQVVDGIRKAKDKLLVTGREGDTMADWLKARGFSAPLAKAATDAAVAEEGKARSLWDIVQGITAHARSIPHADERVELETRAGKLMAQAVGGGS